MSEAFREGCDIVVVGNVNSREPAKGGESFRAAVPRPREMLVEMSRAQSVNAVGD